MGTSLSEAVEIILGGKTGGYYIAGFFFSLLAIILSVYIHSKTRDKNSPCTPYKFSWRFFFWDNAKRIVAGMIVMFILFRAADLSNIYAMLSVGFGVSYSLDKIIQWVMEKSDVIDFLKTDRDNFAKKEDPQ